jgi:hypothetical protein
LAKTPAPLYGGLPPRFIELRNKSTTHHGLRVALCFERRAPTPVGQGWGLLGSGPRLGVQNNDPPRWCSDRPAKVWRALIDSMVLLGSIEIMAISGARVVIGANIAGCCKQDTQGRDERQNSGTVGGGGTGTQESHRPSRSCGPNVQGRTRKLTAQSHAPSPGCPSRAPRITLRSCALDTNRS